MDMTNSFVSVGHGCSFPETKRYNNNNKAADPDMNGDFLGIDDLLDFSNDDIGGPIECCQSNAPTTIPPSDINLGSCNSSKTSSAAPSVFEGGELCVPFDDLAELEWLSNFVEESFSSSDAPANAFLSSSITGASGLEGEKTHQGLTTASPVSILDSNHACNSTKHSTASFTSKLYVPGRARSKRCRTAVCFWNTRILSADDASASILNETCSTSTLQSSDSDTNFTYEQIGEADSFSAPNKLSNHRSNSDYFSATNKSNHRSNCKRLAAQELVSGARRCVHCGVQKTPQWRAGPEGPKTLCNACGVRYKSGRLLPEYRPAASPTFIESIHSNSHRRVMEMRRQREQEENEEHEASASYL